MNNRGFTLIEIMIVVILMAALATMGLSRFNKRSNDIKAAVRKISVLTKELHNAARVNNRTYRLVFEMNADSGHKIWVEAAPKGVLLTKESFHQEIEKDETKEKDKDEKPNPKAFLPDGTVLRKPLELPKPLQIASIEIKGQNMPFESGRAYLYFLPQGLTQEAAIHLSDKKDLNWTIVINPITGHSHVLGENLPLKELRVQ